MRSVPRSVAVVSVLTLLILASCATPSASRRSAATDRITQADIRATLARNAYDAIRLLRRRWLDDIARVYQDGALVSAGALRMIRVERVVEIRYIDHEVARTLYGYNVRGAVIEVDTAAR